MKRLSYSLIVVSVLSACTSAPSGNTSPSPAPSTSSSASASSNPGSTPSASVSPGPATSPSSVSGGLNLSKLSTFAGSKQVVASAKDGSLAEARFFQPAGLVGDGSGSLYVADEGSYTLRKITAQGVSTLAGSGKRGFKDGPAAEAQFSSPRDLVRDPQGNLYIVDGGNHRIRKLSPDGMVSTVAGSGKNEFKDGPAASAGFYNPTGLDRDSQGNLYVADQTNNVIRKITPDGMVSTFAGAADGSSGYADGKAEARFRQPSDVLMTAKGLYVADDGNHAIRLISSDGTVSTVAGAGQRNQGSQDGNLETARLNGPNSLTADAAGNIYFVEFNGNAVRMLSVTGQVTTLVRGVPSGNVDGPLATAKVSAPTGIWCDGTSLFIADRDNQLIRRID